ncbi:histidine kinase [Leptolyngbya sp. 7M]|uniref:histidine kinase n=1 Tax=Leptolyngbya sp. 7M TaxID=2812896 RepID=UPI001B8D5928|nr:histidine kinase [Leptolyngbya sp. 7M]QYO63246.1 GAF domain-containing protein [Leptolyngbya sp. 7M]
MPKCSDASWPIERLNAELQQALDRLTESEKRYRTLFELSSEGILRWGYKQPIPLTLPVDKQLELCYQSIYIAEANAALARMYEFEKSEVLIGLTPNDFHDRYSEVTQAAMRAYIENGYTCHQLETVEFDRRGRKRYFLNSAVSTIENDCVTSTWISQVDITELREAQQALLQAEQDRVAELAKTNQALKNSLDRLAADPDLNAFLGHVLLEISQQLQIDLGYLFFYDPNDQTLTLQMRVTPEAAQLNHELEEIDPFLNPVPIKNLPIWGTLLQTRKPFLITRDNAAQYVFRGTLEWQVQQQDHQAGINLLLTLRDEPIGLLALASTKRSFTPEELELAQALAQQATLAIQLTRLAEAAKAEAQQATLLTERNRIAQELHDTLAQTFTGVIMQLEAAQETIATAPASVQKRLAHAGLLARQGLQEARRSVWSLRPEALEASNLQTALLRLVGQMTDHTAIATEIIVDGTPIALPHEIESHLLRIGQESLTNALKYAQAQQIQLHLQFTPAFVQLKIRDDGQGFDPQQPRQGFGITCMQQRTQQIGGEFTLTSQTGQGTTIQVTIPIV